MLFSEYELPDINETSINEDLGIDYYGIIGSSPFGNTSIGTKWYYNGEEHTTSTALSQAIDFNCNGVIDMGYSHNLNNDKDGDDQDLITTLRGGFNDWNHLQIKSGGIGELQYGYSGEISNLSLNELDLETAVKRNLLCNDVGGSVDIPFPAVKG